MQHRAIIRTDSNSQIGSGHMVRCSAIADKLRTRGFEVLFVVSDEQSASHVETLGYRAEKTSSNPLSFSSRDGNALGNIAKELSADIVLIDSYAVTPDFFSGLNECRLDSGIATAYIDDMFTFEHGILDQPLVWEVDNVINYTFGVSRATYEEMYSTTTKCFVGTEYAPIRTSFSIPGQRIVSENVNRILVTSGSTNPGYFLERVVSVLSRCTNDAEMVVVVGSRADYVGVHSSRIKLLHDVKEMDLLMRSADLAISAAGTTLYELCATGTPTIAIPLVSNQIRNVNGFISDGAGLGMMHLEWSNYDLLTLICKIMYSSETRRALSTRMRDLVDGKGAERIAIGMINPSNYAHGN